MAKDSTAVARVAQAPRMVAVTRSPRHLTPPEKAAVIVRFLLSEGSALPLSSLPDQVQTALAEQMGQMRRIDRTTLDAVLEEFTAELDQLGLSFPGGLEGALSVMGNHLSANAASRLRRMASGTSRADPWDRLVPLSVDVLLPVLEQESTEVAAVMLSKLPVAKAAELLGKLPGPKARRVAYAVSLTGNVDPETVQRIGQSLALQLDQQPLKAFEVGAVERIGAILNISAALTRDAVLEGLEEDDAGFAEQVRRAIFTFAHISARVQPRDVPKLVRVIDQPTLITALAAAQGVADHLAVAEFLLANMSQRMAQGLREELAQRGKIKEKDAEAAMAAIVTAVRQLQAAGEITLISDDD